jgi:hypothetical protein
MASATALGSSLFLDLDLLLDFDRATTKSTAEVFVSRIFDNTNGRAQSQWDKTNLVRRPDESQPTLSILLYAHHAPLPWPLHNAVALYEFVVRVTNQRCLVSSFVCLAF